MGMSNTRFITRQTQSPTTAVGNPTSTPIMIINPSLMLRNSAMIRGPGVGGTSVWVIAAPQPIAVT